MRDPNVNPLPTPQPGKTRWSYSEEESQLPYPLSDGRSLPRVSIITPSYNQALFLEGTIRSVLLQGYPNLEYIIIDGGSTDGSVEIIKKYEPWLAYWVSEKDKGQSQAINKGLRRASGEIIAWLNSDDTYLPGTISTVVQTIEDKRADIVFGECNLVDQNGSLLSHYKTDAPITLKKLILSWKYHFGCPPQPAVFFHRQVLETIGVLDESLHYTLDYDYWLRAVQKYQFIPINRILANYIVHPQSKTGKGQEPFLIEAYLVGKRYVNKLPVIDRVECKLYNFNSMKAQLFLRYAFEAYQHQDPKGIRKWVFAAIQHDFRCLLKRGVISVFIRSYL